MLFPSLKKTKEISGTLSGFGSLVTKGVVPDGGFCRMENLSPVLFPNLSVRQKRGEALLSLPSGGEKITEIINTCDRLLVCTQSAVYLDGVRLDCSLDPTVTARTAIPFGRSVFIVPDGLYIELSDEGVSVKDCSLDLTADGCEIFYSMEDGTELFPSYLGEFPASARPSDFAVIGDGTKMECWQYTGEIWRKMYDVYLKILFPSAVKGIACGQSLYVSGGEELFEDGWRTVISCSDNWAVLTGNLKSHGSCARLRLTKALPPMDFAVEHNNRIYGCRYGKGAEGKFVNEIYVSKLGDPCEWYSFQGISTDSYTVSLGCSGEFTGAAVLGGEVLFFKEDCIIRVLGSMPSEFTVYTLPLTGVEKGHHRSLKCIRDTLFYKSREGITVYDGSSCTVISDSLSLSGFLGGVAGGQDGKYYISLISPEGEGSLFVYDLRRRLWHREDGEGIFLSFERDAKLFFLARSGEGYKVFTPCFTSLTKQECSLKLYDAAPCTLSQENGVKFFFETGKLFEEKTAFNKKIRCIRFSLRADKDSYLRLFVRPDGGDAVAVSFIDRPTDGIFTASVPVPACRFFSLCGEGQGDITLGALECVINPLSEVRDLE